MKVKFSKGEGKVEIQYDKTQPPPGLTEGLMQTTLCITLPSGEKLTSKVACHTGDKFIKRVGRFYAFMKLITEDTNQACEEAIAAHQDTVLKKPEGTGLSQAAKAHYKLCREDRRTTFQIVCPEFFRNTPERRAQRERSIYERLKAKFDNGTTPQVTVVNQKMNNVVGSRVVGAVINTGKRAAK